jgi:predicted GIY-YIG superfamily endonuclease
MPRTAVYLIHFERRYAHAGHYLGFAEDVEARLEQHRRGAGARLMQVIVQAGIGWQLVRTWDEGDRTLERRLKLQKNGPRLCPVCSPRTTTTGTHMARAA